TSYADRAHPGSRLRAPPFRGKPGGQRPRRCGTRGAMAITYKDAGVDIDAGESLVERIKPLARSTMRPEVLGGIGGFAALCRIPSGYTEPVLVSGTDGVGTKLKVAFATGRHDTIGIDLV